MFAPPSHPQLLCAVCRRDKHLPARSYEIDAWKGWWLTGGAELSDGGSACLVVHAAQAAALGHSPGGAGGRPAVPALLVLVLRRVVHLHTGRVLRQVLAVVAEAVLGDLDGIKVALGTPLGGEGHAWEKREGGGGGGYGCHFWYEDKVDHNKTLRSIEKPTVK